MNTNVQMRSYDVVETFHMGGVEATVLWRINILDGEPVAKVAVNAGVGGIPSEDRLTCVPLRNVPMKIIDRVAEAADDDADTIVEARDSGD